LRRVGQLAAHLGDELAVVAGLELGEPGRVFGERVAEAAQQRTALAGRELGPRAGPERPVGRADRGVDVVAIAARDPPRR